MAVGDNQGNTYTGTEGHQRAFILGNPKIDAQADLVDAAIKGQQQDQKNKALAAQTEEARKKALADKFKLGDYFYPHDIEIKNEANRLLEMGAKIQAAGADPFTSSEPIAIKFRQDADRFDRMGEYSKQMKGMYEKDRQDFNERPDKFELDSFENNMAWYENTPLSKAVDESLLPPNLIPKSPIFELQTTYGNLAQKIGLNNKDPQPQDIDQAITIMANDPASKDFVPTITAAYNQLDPESKAQLDNQAKGMGLDPKMLLARNQLQTYFRKEPLDLNKAIDDSMPTGDVTSSEYSKEDLGGVTRFGRKKSDVLSDDKALKHATSQLVLQPQLYQAIVKGGGQNPDGTPISNEKQAAAWLAEVYKTRYKTVQDTSSGVSREGKGADALGEEEAKKDSDLWYSLLMRTENGETQKYYAQIQKKFGFSLEEAKTWAQKQAASFMKGTKNQKGEIVHDATVMLPGDMQTVKVLNPTTGEMVEVAPADPSVRIDIGQKGKETKKSLRDGQEVTEQVDVFNKTGEEYVTTNPNAMGHRKKSDMDMFWKQGVTTRGNRFEILLQQSIEDTPEKVTQGVTIGNADDELQQQQLQGIIPVKTNNQSVNTTTTNKKAFPKK